MKIISWNVNSVHARLPRITALLARHRPDLACLQEIKTSTGEFPAGDFAAAGYQAAVHGQAGRNGVAVLSRMMLTDVACGFANDPVLDWGLTDLGRAGNPGPGPYTFWDYRQGAFHRGWGLRIDLALATAPVAARSTSVTVDRDERKPTAGEGKPSDHAPLIITLTADGR